ncbi:hypothetical protein IFM89_024524 [Coptis chinensis]|uniref:Myb/SANT-like domain-containing protein n=1 Tax=Coptis chinensis TaxID=261450 RepID=A0A835HRS8_9MAGN|nr:hypothetical protein IFM89_024524 [Coptis chinensis]
MESGGVNPTNAGGVKPTIDNGNGKCKDCEKTNKTQVRWYPNMEAILAEVLLEEAATGGKKADNGWKTESLKRIADEINRRLNMTLVFDNVRSSKKIDADDDAWASYVKAHPEAKTLRQKMFPHYDQRCIIFGKNFATGEGGNSGFDGDITVSYVNLGGSPGDGSQVDSEVKSTAPTAKKGKKSMLFEDIPKPLSFKVFTEAVVEIAKSFKAPVKPIEMLKEALKAFPDMEPELYLRSECWLCVLPLAAAAVVCVQVVLSECGESVVLSECGESVSVLSV